MAGCGHEEIAGETRWRRALRTARVPVVICLTLLYASPATGDVSLTFDVGNIEAAGWQARAVSMVLTLQDSGELAGTVVAQTVLLPEPIGRIEGAQVHCGRLEYSRQGVRCDRARLEPGTIPLGLSALVGWIEYRTDKGVLDLNLTADDRTVGALRLVGQLSDSNWSVDLTAEGLELAGWAEAIGIIQTSDESGAQIEQGHLSGLFDIRLQAQGRGEALEAVYEGAVDRLTGYNVTGTTAAEGLAVGFTGRVEIESGQARFETQLSISAGEFYQEPVYADLSVHPLTIELQGRGSTAAIELDDIRIRQEKVLDASGKASLRQGGDQRWQVSDATLRLEQLILPGAYDVLLQPLLADTDLADMETTGSLSGELRLTDNKITAAAVEIEDVYLDDREGRLAVYGLDADLIWGANEGARPMSIRWDGGFVYGISYGAAVLDFAPRGNGWTLARPVAVPVLDGALEIDLLEFGGVAAEEASMAFDARLTPIDMRWLARALDWPPLSGTLSGEIPSLTYENGEIAIAGALEARMFDGVVTVADLRVREPFSERAILRANIDLQRLDLRLVTEAFAFGLITGRLDGHVHDLVMVDWSPQLFDARLYTSRGDKSGRRISQRAVDNIASLGGAGGAAALSSGFLRFFDDFAYDRISIGCKLVYGVCEMSGIEPAGRGYLILRGRGLPQINVVGFARRVSWPTVVAQLKTILESEGPVIE